MNKRKKNAAVTSKRREVRTKYFDRSELKIILLILVCSLLLRLFYIYETVDSPFYLNLFSDSKIYFDWAMKIIQTGNWIGDEVFFMSPGYPYILSFIFIFIGHSILAVQIIQAIISTCTVLLIYLTARNLFGKNSAYFAAGLASTYSLFIFYAGTVLGETVQIFLISYLCFLISKNDDGNWGRWFKIGLVLGAASLFRANILVYVIFILGGMALRYFRKNIDSKILRHVALSFLAGVLIPVVIVTARNYLISDDFVIISSNGGINFFIGNNENSPGVYLMPKGFDLYRDMPGEKFAEKITGRNLSPSEVSKYWYNRGANFIFSHPADALFLFGRKLLLLIDNDENPQSSTTDVNFFRENYSNLLKLPLPSFLFILLSAILGIYFSIKFRKQVKYLLLFLISVALSTAIFFVIGRFRLAAAPILIIFAGYGIEELIKILKTKNYSVLTKPASLLLIIIGVQLVIPQFNYNNSDAWSNLADVYFQNKKYDEAILYAQKSLVLKETDFAFVLLANSYAAKGNREAAFTNYNNAILTNPESVLAYFNLGLFYTQQQNFEQALLNYNQAIKFDPAFAEAYRNMAIIYYIVEDYERSLPLFEKYLSLISDEQIKATVLQDINEIRNRLREKK